MKIISSTAGILCTCTIACVLIRMLIPDGVTRKTMNLVVSAFLVLILISPIKNLFEQSDGFSFATPDESKIMSQYDSKVLSMTKENLRNSLSQMLNSRGIAHGKIYVSLKSDLKNGIIIDYLCIYIDNSANISEVIDLIEDNFKITPEIILE